SVGRRRNPWQVESRARAERDRSGARGERDAWGDLVWQSDRWPAAWSHRTAGQERDRGPPAGQERDRGPPAAQERDRGPPAGRERDRGPPAGLLGVASHER